MPREQRVFRLFEGQERMLREEDDMSTMKWTQRICVSAGIALASVFVVPAVAGAAADSSCYASCSPPTVNNTSVPPPTTGPGSPTVQPVHTTVSVDGSSSLPFTGADIGELAAVGVGAIVLGGVLARRRRSAS
jgi:hypothetical protein